MPIDDYAASAVTTGVLYAGDSATGTFTGSDSDWFAVELAAGLTYRFSASSSGSGSTYLSLNDPFGHWLATGGLDGGGDGGFSYTAPFSLTYYLAITGSAADGSQQRYTVTASAGALVPDDYSATPATGGQVAAGGAATGAIETGGDQDWFAITLTAGETYTFALTPAASGGLVNGALGLYDAVGNPVNAGGFFGWSVGGSLRITAEESGGYYLGVRSYASSTGGYTVTASSGEVVVDDYAADATTSGVLADGGTVTGAIELNNDRDWFTVTLAEDYAYTFDLIAQDGGHASLELYDAAGGWVAYGSYTADGNSQLFHLADQGGTYYLSVSSWYAGTGGYTLSAAPGYLLVDDQPATTATTGQAAEGETVQGSIDYRGDGDWFAVQLTGGVTYAFDLMGAGEDGLADPYLSLYQNSGYWLTSDDDSGEGLNAHLVYRAETSGAYFLAASSYQQGVGGYTLSVARSDEEPPKTSGWIYPVGPWLDVAATSGGATSFGAILTASAATTVLNGSGGVDVADFSRYARSELTISGEAAAGGGWQVTLPGGTESSALNGVERLQLADGAAVALDVFDPTDSAGAVLALWQAGFDTLPDALSLGQWLAVADRWNSAASTSGSLVSDLAQAMLDTYAPQGLSDAELVELLHTNILGAPPDADTLALYTGLLAEGAYTQAGLLAAVAQSATNTSQYQELIGDGVAYTQVSIGIDGSEPGKANSASVGLVGVAATLGGEFLLA